MSTATRNPRLPRTDNGAHPIITYDYDAEWSTPEPLTPSGLPFGDFTNHPNDSPLDSNPHGTRQRKPKTPAKRATARERDPNAIERNLPQRATLSLTLTLFILATLTPLPKLVSLLNSTPAPTPMRDNWLSTPASAAIGWLLALALLLAFQTHALYLTLRNDPRGAVWATLLGLPWLLTTAILLAIPAQTGFPTPLLALALTIALTQVIVGAMLSHKQ